MHAGTLLPPSRDPEAEAAAAEEAEEAEAAADAADAHRTRMTALRRALSENDEDDDDDEGGHQFETVRISACSARQSAASSRQSAAFGAGGMPSPPRPLMRSNSSRGSARGSRVDVTKFAASRSANAGSGRLDLGGGRPKVRELEPRLLLMASDGFDRPRPDRA